MGGTTNPKFTNPIVTTSTGAGAGSDGVLGGIAASQHTASVTLPLTNSKTSLNLQAGTTSATGFDGTITGLGADPLTGRGPDGRETLLTRPGYQMPVSESYLLSGALTKTIAQTAHHMATLGVRVDGGLVNDNAPVFDALALPHNNQRSLDNTAAKKPIGMVGVNGSYARIAPGKKADASLTGFAAVVAGSSNAATAGVEFALTSHDANFPTTIHSAQVGQAPIHHSTGGFNKPGSFKAALTLQTYLSAPSDYRTRVSYDVTQPNKGGNDAMSFTGTQFGKTYLGDATLKHPDGAIEKLPQYNVERYTIPLRDNLPQREPYAINPVIVAGGLDLQYALSKRVSINAGAKLMTNPVKPGTITLDSITHILGDNHSLREIPAAPGLTPAPGQTRVLTKQRLLNFDEPEGSFIAPPPKFQGMASVGVKVTLGK